MTAAAEAAFPAVHGFVIAGFAASFFLSAAGRKTAGGRTFRLTMLLLTACILLIVFAAKRLPLYGMFESITTILWSAGLCFYIYGGVRKASASEFFLCCAVMLLISGLVLTGQAGLSSDFFMYQVPWVQSFFFSARIAAGIILFAGIRYSAALKDSFDSRSPGSCPKNQDFLLLAGAVFFLCSEFSGSIWCLKGWGDSWRWSSNFFQSAAIFFLLMLNLHIPLSLSARPRIVNALGAFSSYAAVFLFLY